MKVRSEHVHHFKLMCLAKCLELNTARDRVCLHNGHDNFIDHPLDLKLKHSVEEFNKIDTLLYAEIFVELSEWPIHDPVLYLRPGLNIRLPTRP